jgi:hypothetical protein
MYVMPFRGSAQEIRAGYLPKNRPIYDGKPAKNRRKTGLIFP